MEVDRREKKNKNTKIVTILVVFLIVFAIVILILVNLFSEKTTVTTGGSEVTSSSSLYCTTRSKNIPDAFFDLEKADTAEQAIKVLFRDNKIDNIAYNTTITYSDPDKAKQEEANFHARYGTYVQDNGKNMDIFSPNFAVSGNEVRISLYSDYKELNNSFAKIFLIDTTDTSLSSYNAKVLSTLYKTKGFTCESNSKDSSTDSSTNKTTNNSNATKKNTAP